MIRGWLRRPKRRLINATKRRVSAMLPYRPMPGTAKVLDEEYASGLWDCLRSIREVPRHGVMAGYCHHLRPGGAILEIGCGEGILQERLEAARYSRYLGIDVSAEAIQRTLTKAGERTGFVVADAETFVPDQRYDLVLFNECLEYFAEPLALVQRYERFLAAEGLFIVSMFAGIDTARTSHIWRMLRSRYAEVAYTRLTIGSGYTWLIKVLAPPKPTGT